jgi:hypothetical protein
MSSRRISTRIRKSVFAGLALAVAVLWAGIYLTQPAAPQHAAARATATLPTPNPAAAPTLRLTSSAADVALQRGITYEKSNIAHIASFERLFFEYLQRQYGIDQVFSASHTPINSPGPQQHQDTQQFLALRRIAYPTSFVQKLPIVQNDSITDMLLRAANCDHIVLPSDYDTLVNQNLEAGGYNLTHVLLALEFMADNGCNYYTSAQVQSLQDQVTTGMTKLANNLTTDADLRYEATAFLFWQGHTDNVTAAAVQQIVQSQLPSGGWGASVGDVTTSDHATLLAIWALLAYSHQPAHNQPIIRRPN